MKTNRKIVKESYEVSPELASRLNAILADEWLAAEQYKLTSILMKGNKQHRIEEIAEKNAKDELEDHFDNLCDWMQSKGIPVEVEGHWKFDQNRHSTKFDLKEGMSTKDVVDILIKGEEEAIEDYEEVIPETDLDLKVMLCGFLKDEREHLKELKDCKDEMNGGNEEMKKNRPNVFERRRFDESSYEGYPYKVSHIAWDTDLPDGPEEVELPKPPPPGRIRKAIADFLEIEYSARPIKFKYEASDDLDYEHDAAKFIVSDIKWKTDLPDTVIVDVPEEVVAADEEEDYISDYLSDEYGFCHNGFLYDPVGEDDDDEYDDEDDGTDAGTEKLRKSLERIDFTPDWLREKRKGKK